MKVFVTGAAGFIGRATTQELISHGHTVIGLTRNEANVEILNKLGATVHKGDLTDIESLKSGAQQADAVIHLAFIHDFSALDKSVAIDQAAISAMGEALAGSNKPFVLASGTLLTAGNLSPGQVATEDMDTVRDGSPFSLRARSADLVYELTKSKGISGMVVRIPPTVHGKGDQGLIPSIVAAAKRNGVAIYTGDGSQRWATVNLHDAAALFRLAVEKGTAGATYHVVGEEGVSMKDVNETIGKALNIPVRQTDNVEEAAQLMGFLGHVTAINGPCSSARTQKELGWTPTGPGLLQDMSDYYFTDEAVSSGKY